MNQIEYFVIAGIVAALEAFEGLSTAYQWTVILLLLLLAYAAAAVFQRLLVRHFRTHPEAEAPLAKMEALFSLAAPLTVPFLLAVRLVLAFRTRVVLGRKSGNSRKASRKAKRKANKTAPIRVATLGPTFFLAGLGVGFTYWLGWLANPLLATMAGLSPGHSYWQYRFLGSRPELAWLLPLDDRPNLALFLCLLFWLLVWWTLGNLVRAVGFHSALRKNHASDPDPPELDLWRSGFGVDQLVRTSSSYRQWASWVVTAGILLVAVGLFLRDGESDVLGPSEAAMGLVLALSWTIHIRMKGLSTGPEEASLQPDSLPPRALPGWPDARAVLQSRYGCEPPDAMADRPVTHPKPSQMPQNGSVTSPLVLEALGVDTDPTSEDGEAGRQMGFTPLQEKVLRSLSLQSFVHVDPPTADEALVLDARGAQRLEDRSGLSERHQIVLAPEGSGKSTLGMFAAANHVLSHARATLWITDKGEQAQARAQILRDTADRSVSRWNLRVRGLGQDFASDLSRHIIPDVMVASLDDLVTGVLDHREVYEPFLRQVGLVVVDDAESFVGARELHAKLAFRRLQMLFAHLADRHLAADPDPRDEGPLFLVLATDTMEQPAAWIESLCGLRASVRTFEPPPAKSKEISSAQDLLRFGEPGREDEDDDQENKQQGDEQPEDSPSTRQVLHRLGDWHTGSGLPLQSADLVAACEAAGVPWSYRTAGDGRRHIGRSTLRLDREPDHYVDSVRQACVLVVEGRWSEVRREMDRLACAGIDSDRDEIAVFARLDPEETAALETIVPNLGHSQGAPGEGPANSPLAEQALSLPRPVIWRPPEPAVRSHLMADLLQDWIEVADLVETYSPQVAECLRHLEAERLLYTEEREDIKPGLNEYESKVFVRAVANSVSHEAAGPDESSNDSDLYRKVSQVDYVSKRAVRVVDLSNQRILRYVDADSAPLVFYTGRIFEVSQGRFEVTARAFAPATDSDVQVEKSLRRGTSSPRRQCQIQPDPSIDLPYPHVPSELVLMGSDPLAIGLEPVQMWFHHVATYVVDPSSGTVLSRELYDTTQRQGAASEVPESDAAGTILPTVALTLRPNPERLPSHASGLRFGQARLLTSVLRYLLPLIYRDVEHHVDVLLHLVEPPLADEPWSYELTPRDGIHFFDLHHGGNGTAAALHHDGLDLLLRFARLVLQTNQDLERIRRLHDLWANLDEILADGAVEGDQESEETGCAWPWDDIRVELLQWLDRRVHPEISLEPRPASPEREEDTADDLNDEPGAETDDEPDDGPGDEPGELPDEDATDRETDPS